MNTLIPEYCYECSESAWLRRMMVEATTSDAISSLQAQLRCECDKCGYNMDAKTVNSKEINQGKSMTGQIKGIPTMYAGRRFRSRLEARWAALFDLFGWKYEYEPYDLEGWIPDFVLSGAKEEVLVEVKPFYRLGEFDVGKLTQALKGTEKERCDILLLGCTIFIGDYGYSSIALGWLGEYMGSNIRGGDHEFAYAILNFWDNKWGFYHEWYSFRDRITGLCDGDHYLYNPDPEVVSNLWAIAGNIVQYKFREKD